MATPNKRPRLSDSRTPSMQVKVVAVKDSTKVQHWDFNKEQATPRSIHRNTVAGITDGKRALRFTLFRDLADKINEGQSYIVKDYAVSKFGEDTILCTK